MADKPRTQDFASRVEGADAKNASTSGGTSDPFAAQRTDDNNPFSKGGDDQVGDMAGSPPGGLSPPPPGNRDRRLSKEWDASKVPPSRFQKREGSIYSTPGSRDAHVKGKERDSAYHAKLKEKGWV